MAEGTDNVEDRISCDDSSYGEHNLEVYDSGDGVNSGSEDEEYGGGDTDALDQFEAVYTQDLREERSSVTLTQSMETVDPLRI